MIDTEARDRQRPANGIWKQDPRLLADYADAKASRDITKLPIGQRFQERLEQIRIWASKFIDVRFLVTTNPQTYIDDQTKQEEPESFELKWKKKTWCGIWPDKGKPSDFDLNPQWKSNAWFSAGECEALLLGDPKRIHAHLIDLRPDIRVDVYRHKNENGFYL